MFHTAGGRGHMNTSLFKPGWGETSCCDKRWPHRLYMARICGSVSIKDRMRG